MAITSYLPILRTLPYLCEASLNDPPILSPAVICGGGGTAGYLLINLLIAMCT